MDVGKKGVSINTLHKVSDSPVFPYTPSPLTTSTAVVYPCVQKRSDLYGITDQNAWKVLRTATVLPEELSVLREKVKYLAILPNMEGAMVLVDNGRGLLQPQSAFYVAENVIFVFDGSLLCSRTVRMILYRNPSWIFTLSGKGISFSTTEIASFLYFVGENSLVKKMLQYDGCYSVVDRFMLAMGFVYLKRASLSEYFFTNIISVLAALLLAHKMEEDDCPGKGLLQIICHCLPSSTAQNDKLKLVSAVVSFQAILFQKMSYRSWVSSDECEEIISVTPNHPLWRRWRLSFHGGAVRSTHYTWKLNVVRSASARLVSNGLNSARFTLVVNSAPKSTHKCSMCYGNSVYASSAQERFTKKDNFGMQKAHLGNMLTSLSEVHQVNLKVCSIYPEVAQKLEHLPVNLAAFLPPRLESRWPSEYLELLQIESGIENILAAENSLQKLLALMQIKMLVSANHFV